MTAPWLTKVTAEQRIADEKLHHDHQECSTIEHAPSGLATLPAETMLDTGDLAKLLGCCKVSVQRAARRNELPASFKFQGRSVWLAGAIRAHLQLLQSAALEQEKRTNSKRS